MIREFRRGDEIGWCRVREENLIRINSKYYPPGIITALLKSNVPKRALKNSESDFMLVYEHDGKIIGTIRMTREGEIMNCFVKPSYQSNGVGKELLKSVEIKASELGLDKLFLYASVNAQDFYESNGYLKEHDETDEISGEKYHLIFMTKRI